MPRERTTTMTERAYLDCPSCGEPCAEIPCCQEISSACGTQECEESAGPTWCNGRRGVCACGARLFVDADGENAWLEEEEHDDA